MRVAIAAVALAALAGCSGGSYAEQEKEVKLQVARYFAELNAQAAASAQQAKATTTDIDLPATALTLNRYEWDINGAVYPDVECPSATCKAKLGKLATAGGELRCPNCNIELMTELTRIGRAVPMLEIKSASNTPPIVVLVRYIRRSYAYDPTAAVMVSAKAESAFPIKDYTNSDLRGKGAYYGGGFYRPTGVAHGTTGFVYRGGELNQIDPDSVKKMIKDPPEIPTVSSMKLGRWAGVEETWKPWLAKPPVTEAAKETPKSE